MVRVSELISWLQNLHQDYDIDIFDNESGEGKEISIIEEWGLTRSYTIFPEES